MAAALAHSSQIMSAALISSMYSWGSEEQKDFGLVLVGKAVGEIFDKVIKLVPNTDKGEFWILQFGV